MNKLYIFGSIILYSCVIWAMDPPEYENNKAPYCNYLPKDSALAQYIKDFKNNLYTPELALKEALIYQNSIFVWHRRFSAIIFGKLVKHSGYEASALQFAQQAIYDSDPVVRNAVLEIYIPMVRQKKKLKEALRAARIVYNSLPHFHPYLIDSFWRLNNEFVAQGKILEVANDMAFQCLNDPPRVSVPGNICGQMGISYDNWVAAIEFYRAAVVHGKFKAFAEKAAFLASMERSPKLAQANNKLLEALSITAESLTTKYGIKNKSCLIPVLRQNRWALEMNWPGAVKVTIGQAKLNINSPKPFKCPFIISLTVLMYTELLKHGQVPLNSAEYVQSQSQNTDEWVQQAIKIYKKNTHIAEMRKK